MSMHRWFVWVSIAAVVAAAAPLSANDWPQWLGPKRTGESTETGWRTDWSSNPPKELWRARVGLGFSSTAVADGRLFTLGHADGNEVITCLDAATGKEQWTVEYKCDKIARFYEGGSSSTPTIDGDRAYVVGKEGQFHCLDVKTGEKVWYHDLREVLGTKTPEWGFACSPLILSDRVIVQAGGVAAFNKKTGERVWVSDQRFSPGYGSPVAFDFNGKTMLAALNNDALIIVDASDGSVKATTRWKTRFATSASTPIVVGDQIFISTGYEEGCGLFRFTGDALEEIYRNEDMANHMNNCMLHEGKLYGFDGNAHRGPRPAALKCIDFKTGKVHWSQDGLGCGALTLVDGKLLVMSEKGDLILAAASPDGYKELGRVDRAVPGKVWTIPVLSNGRIYCRSSPGNLVCYEVKK